MIVVLMIVRGLSLVMTGQLCYDMRQFENHKSLPVPDKTG